jgi:HJR/Mrr/RecB family endonuclease
VQSDSAKFGNFIVWACLLSWYWIAAFVNSKGVSWWLAIVVAGSVLVVAGSVIGQSIRVAKWINANRRCEHGVRAGKTGRCDTCEAIAQRAAQKQMIVKESEALQLREKQRLSEAWLSNAESYFKMKSQEFETAVAVLFRKLDYKVLQTPFSNDGGKDAVVWKDGKKYLIECKRYAEGQSIGRRDLQILVAAMLEEKAAGGIYVNTGRFTETAVAYALQNRIDLYDRNRLPALVNKAYGVPVGATRADVMCPECGQIHSLALGTTGTCRNGHRIANNLRMEDMSVLGSLEPPRCKKCGREMKVVKGSRGPFWGCSQYPACKSSQPIMGKAERFRGRWGR